MQLLQGHLKQLTSFRLPCYDIKKRCAHRHVTAANGALSRTRNRATAGIGSDRAFRSHCCCSEPVAGASLPPQLRED